MLNTPHFESESHISHRIPRAHKHHDVTDLSTPQSTPDLDVTEAGPPSRSQSPPRFQSPPSRELNEYPTPLPPPSPESPPWPPTSHESEAYDARCVARAQKPHTMTDFSTRPELAITEAGPASRDHSPPPIPRDPIECNRFDPTLSPFPGKPPTPMSKSGRGQKTAEGKISQDTEPIYFWREYEQPYGFLSQWYSCTFTSPPRISSSRTAAPSEPRPPYQTEKPKPQGAITYTSTEQYMMHFKALLFSDYPTASKILSSTSPRTHRDLGRRIANYSSETWDPVRYAIVREGNLLKFRQAKTTFPDSNGVGVPLRQLLLGTGERALVEASPVDRIWGIGLGREEADGSRERWGRNLLGKALMEVRGELREEERKRTGGEGGKGKDSEREV